MTKFAAAYNNYGNLLNDKARLPEARQCFVRAIEINPEDHIAYWNLHATSTEMDESNHHRSAYQSHQPMRAAIFTLAGLRAFNGDERAFKELLEYGFQDEAASAIDRGYYLCQKCQKFISTGGPFTIVLSHSQIAKERSTSSVYGWVTRLNT